MGWFSAIGDAGASIGKTGTKVLDDVPIRVDAPVIRPGDAGSVKPTGGLSAGVGVAGLGVGAVAFVLPTILNSSAVSTAIQTAGDVGQAAIYGNIVGETLADITSNPVSLAIVGAVAVGGLYLFFRR